MHIRNTLQSKKVHIGTLVAIMMLIASLFAYKALHKPTLTTYKDEQFIIYDCTRPIKAKKGTVPDLVMGGRMNALVPAAQSEAKRYCHASGTE